MRIPLGPLLPVALVLSAAAARPDEPDPEVVKAVRAMLDTKKEEERDAMKAALLKRPDLDWAALKAGLEQGPYYQKPLETAFGERHSKSTFDLVFSGEDGRPRGFSMWVPKKYDAKERLPVLFYLHHDPQADEVQAGFEKAGQAIARLRQVCEERGIFLVAPHTSVGAEWWTPQGERLVAWTLKRVRERYNIDYDRIGLVGALGGGDAVWYLGQEMPGTWSSLMPMTGDPYEITALIRPLFLGTLDRMDVLMGVPSNIDSTVGKKEIGRFLAELKPMFDQRLRITTAIWPTAQSDFSYLEKIAGQIASFVCDRKRDGYADEVDVETEEGDGLRCLWLRNDGYDAEGASMLNHGFPTTLLKWTAPERKEADKRIGVESEPREGMPGLFIKGTPDAAGEAGKSQIFPGDVILEINGIPVSKPEDLKAIVEKTAWGDEVRILLARDLKETDLPRHEKGEARYKRYRAKVEELKAAGKPVPPNLLEEMAEEGPGEEEEKPAEEDDSGISVSDDSEIAEDGGGGGGGPVADVKKTVRLIERWVRIRRPAGVLVRADFGAQWDRSYTKTEGVRIEGVYAGSLAARSGFKKGDLIVGVGGKEVKNIHDIEDALATINDDGTAFRFEQEPDDANFIDFTVRRQNADGSYQGQGETGLTVRWKPVRSSRVDGKWDKADKTLNVLANNVSGFTLYFTDALIEPGKEFHLFINDVTYQDLVDHASAPEYPKAHDDPAVADEVYRLRKRRAKVEGWKPDLAWALEDFLVTWDRKQVYGAERTFDLTKMKAGFDQAKERAKRDDDLGPRVRKAYEEYPGRAKG